MRKFIITILFFITVSNLFAEIGVKSFRKLENDLDARVYAKKIDQNGDVCAIIKVVTSQNGFFWEPDGLGIMSSEWKNGEYWLYVPYAAKRLTIKHDKLGILRDYMYPMPIEKATVYEMVLVTGKVITTVQENEIESQWLIINSDPTDADVYINNQAAGKTPYQNELPVGKYTWRLQKELYMNDAGAVELVAGGEKQKIDVVLKLNFGSLEITSVPDSGATVKLDGIPTGKTTPCVLENIPTGDHSVSVNLDMYETTSQRFSLAAGETKPIIIPMNAVFADVKITTEPISDIFINGQFKANDKWQGRLTQGVYTFEAKKDKYTTYTEKKTVLVGQPIFLNLQPIPRYGTLKVLTKPIEATITIDGNNMGQSPVTLKNLLIGDYFVELSKSGFENRIEKVTITEGQTTTLNSNLTNERNVTINSNPSNADLFIDNKKVGKTPYTGGLSFGNHLLQVESDGRKVDKTVMITRTGGETEFTLKFGYLVNIKSIPTSATLFIDKSESGTTPYSAYLSFGNHILRIEKDGKSAEKTVFISQTSSEITIDMYASQPSQIEPKTEEVKVEILKATPEKKSGVSTDVFILGGISYPLIRSAAGSIFDNGLAYNLKIGVAKTIGVYAGLSTNMSQTTIDYTAGNLPKEYYSKTAASSSYNRFGVVGGLVLNVNPIMLYAGAGYGYFTHYVTTDLYKYSDDTFAKQVKYGDTNSYSGIETEVGMMVNTYPIGLSVGVSSINFKYMELKLGIGIVF